MFRTVIIMHSTYACLKSTFHSITYCKSKTPGLCRIFKFLGKGKGKSDTRYTSEIKSFIFVEKISFKKR